jgi:hypothetical protein
MELRLATPADLPYIADTWVRNYASSDWAKYCTPPDVWRRNGGRGGLEYYQGHRRLVDRLMTRGLRVVERDGLIGGWACVDVAADGMPLVHYAFVRRLYQGEGVARALLGDLIGVPVVYSHRSAELRQNRLPSQWRFDPYAAFTGGRDS